MSVPLVFLDTETTGLHADREIWEYGLIRREPDGTEEEFHAFVDVDLSLADPFALQIGGFYERSPQGRRLSGAIPDDESNVSRRLLEVRPLAKREACRAVARLTHGAHIVGAVVNFDMETIDRDLRGCGLTKAWHYHLVDVENLAVGHINCLHRGIVEAGNPPLPGFPDVLMPPWDSQELGRLLGVEITDKDRHTAMGDARWAMRIWDAVMGS